MADHDPYLPPGTEDHPVSPRPELFRKRESFHIRIIYALPSLLYIFAIKFLASFERIDSRFFSELGRSGQWVLFFLFALPAAIFLASHHRKNDQSSRLSFALTVIFQLAIQVVALFATAVVLSVVAGVF